MHPTTSLRFEGLAVFAASLGGYFVVGGPLWLLLVLALAPDLSMAGYLGGPRIGALVYNVFHVYALPLALGAAGYWAGTELAILAALVWTGHIGADRAFGYGLKFESGFGDTHLRTSRKRVGTESN